MRTKVKLFVVLSISLLACSIFCFSHRAQVGSIVLDNVNALASTDGYEFYCLGKGTVACPSGQKVDYLVVLTREQSGFSIE